MLYKSRGNVPKHIQHNEYQYCIDLAYKLLDTIYNANSDMLNRKKYTILLKKLCKFIEFRITFFQESRILPTKQATQIVLKLQHIYNMANNWK